MTKRTTQFWMGRSPGPTICLTPFDFFNVEISGVLQSGSSRERPIHPSEFTKYSDKFQMGNQPIARFSALTIVVFTLFAFQNCGDVKLLRTQVQLASIATPTPVVVPVSPTPSATPITPPDPGPPATPALDPVTYQSQPSPVITQPPSGGTYCNGATYFTPSNISSSVTYNGVTYPLSIVGSAFNGDCLSTSLAELDPLNVAQRLDIRFWTRLGIYSLRFRTPSTISVFPFDFLIDAGVANNPQGMRFSISAMPGEFFDGRAMSTSYCDGGTLRPPTGVVATTVTSTFAGKGLCQLLPNHYYYLNILVPRPDPAVSGQLNNSVIGTTPEACPNNGVFSTCKYIVN